MSEAITANAAAMDSFEPTQDDDFDFEVHMNDSASRQVQQVDEEAEDLAPQVGQPKTEGQFQLQEKFKGKSPEDIARAYEEAERAMRKAQDEAAEDRRRFRAEAEELRRQHEQIRSQYELDKLKYDQAVTRKQSQGELTAEEKEFLQDVNDDPKVLRAVNRIAALRAEEIVRQRIDPVLHEATTLKSQMYNVTTDQYLRANNISREEYDEAVKIGADVGGILYQHFKQTGLSEDQAQRLYNSISYDARMLPFTLLAARGSKPSKAAVSSVVQQTPQGPDPKKKHLSGGSSASSSSDSGVLPPLQDFEKLSADQMREQLRKAGYKI